jgi:hypothetical protein
MTGTVGISAIAGIGRDLRQNYAVYKLALVIEDLYGAALRQAHFPLQQV